MIETHVADLERHMRSGTLAMFCGAGISKEGGLPLAGELQTEVTTCLLDDKEAALVSGAQIAFELFMERIDEHTDVLDLLALFAEGSPARWHHIAAQLIARRLLARVITTNFDLLFEQALDAVGLAGQYQLGRSEADLANLAAHTSASCSIVKVHGSVDHRESLRATLRGVAAEILTAPRRAVIESVFSTGQHDAILVVGYSCSDLFDLTPAIRELDSPRKRVYLVDHSPASYGAESLADLPAGHPFRDYPGVRLVLDANVLAARIASSMDLPIRPASTVTSWRRYVRSWAGRVQAQPFAREILCAALLRTAGAFSEALRRYERAELCASESYERISCYLGQTITLAGLGRHVAAIECSRKALDLAEREEDSDGALRAHGNLGALYCFRKEYEQALDHHESARDLAQRLQREDEYFRCLGNIGGVLCELRRYEAALEQINQQLAYTQREGLKLSQATCLANVAEIHTRTENHKGALEGYTAALTIVRHCGDREREQKMLNNLASVCVRLKNYAAAQDHQERALALAVELGDERGEFICYENLVPIFMARGSLADAALLCLRAAASADRLGDRSKSGRYLASGGDFLLGVGRYAEARTHLASALERLVGSEDEKVVRLVQERLRAMDNRGV